VNASHPPPPAPPPNTAFGAYVLLDRIAVGGMAEVFRAQPRARDGGQSAKPEPRGRLVVIKRMLPAVAADPEGRAMFAQEARIGRSVRHANVVELIAHGEVQGQPYLELELVEGVDLWRLGRWLRRMGRRLEQPVAVLVVRELLAGLEAVHEARDEQGSALGLVHRDVSPSNVLVSVHGDVKLADFGIARARASAGPMSERAKGKLGYLSPEQVQGYQTDRRADVFAAGVIAAELMMGRPLFVGGSELAILLAIRDGKVQPFVEHAESLPAGLRDPIMQALTTSPHERIASASALRDALEPFQTADEPALRRELGALVRQALLSADPIDLGEPSELSQNADAATPRITAQGEEQAPEEEPTAQYRVMLANGEQRGPWRFARIVEAVATGEIGPTDRVSVSGGAPQALAQIADLARHLQPSTLTPRAAPKRFAMAMTDEYVDLEHGGIVGALARALVERETALLICENGAARKEVYLKDGVPEFVTSNLAGELLGEYLVSKGVIARGELDMALAVMPRFEGKLGETLNALGLVEPVNLLRHIADQVRDKLLDVFTWPKGKASLYRDVAPPASGFPLHLEPWAVLQDGIKRRFDAGLEQGRFRGRDAAKLERISPPPEELRSVKLPRDLDLVLNALRTPRTVADIRRSLLADDKRDPTRPLRAVVLLLHLGALRWVD